MILLSWNPILVIIMIAVSILMFIGQIYVGNKEFLMRYERSGKERKAWYYTYLLTHDTAFKEVKAYGLKGMRKRGRPKKENSDECTREDSGRD